MAEYQSNPHPFSAQVSELDAIHICPDCKFNIASGTNIDGNPALRTNCTALQSFAEHAFAFFPHASKPASPDGGNDCE